MIRTTLAALAAALTTVALLATPADAAYLSNTKCDTNPPRGDMNVCVDIYLRTQHDGTGKEIARVEWYVIGDRDDLETCPGATGQTTIYKSTTMVAEQYAAPCASDFYHATLKGMAGTNVNSNHYLVLDYKLRVDNDSDSYGRITMSVL